MGFLCANAMATEPLICPKHLESRWEGWRDVGDQLENRFLKISFPGIPAQCCKQHVKKMSMFSRARHVDHKLVLRWILGAMGSELHLRKLPAWNGRMTAAARMSRWQRALGLLLQMKYLEGKKLLAVQFFAALCWYFTWAAQESASINDSALVVVFGAPLSSINILCGPHLKGFPALPEAKLEPSCEDVDEPWFAAKSVVNAVLPPPLKSFQATSKSLYSRAKTLDSPSQSSS